MLKEAVQILHDEGSVEYAKNISINKVSSAWKEIEPVLPDCDAKDDLYDLQQYLITRSL